jgi:CPA1 family monovalent cation:H+ antiporter
VTPFQILAILLTLAAAFAYVNHRFLRLPTAIGLMVMAMAVSVALIGLDKIGLPVSAHAHELLARIDFDDAVLHGMLGLLLFAGALHVDLGEIAAQKWPILTLAVAGTLTSTALIGVAVWQLSILVGVDLPFIHALLFGALISPTDPIAVLGILKKAGVPKSLEITIAGESLFNDGVGVVVFMVVLGLAGGGEVTAGEVGLFFVREALGGALFGLAGGYLAFRMLKSIDDYVVEVLITLALTTGGYALAEKLHISAPIAAVVSGLLIGNHGRQLAMSETTREHLDLFWELIDEILNALLFILMGLEILVVTASPAGYLLAALAIPVVLLSRLVSVGAPMLALRGSRKFSKGAVAILTWGGLRGGISVALALSLHAGTGHDAILPLTYAVVVFSILVQGITMGPLLRRLGR